jgi:hypothetical protein
MIFGTSIDCSLDCGVMEDLEGCMQHGVATSPYTHRVVAHVPCNALIFTSMGMQLLL